MTEDTRFVYAASCAWFGPIAEAGGRAGLPCCPRCGSMLFEYPTREPFFEAARRHDAAGHPGYVEMIRWVDEQYRAGGHFRDYNAAAEAYRRRTGKEVGI